MKKLGSWDCLLAMVTLLLCTPYGYSMSQFDLITPNIIRDTTPVLFPDSKSFMIPYECQIAFDGIDPVTGERKKELAYESLFSYTAPHIKTYVPGHDLLEADARLIRFGGGYTYLSILFHWNAKKPETAYGRLKNKGAIRCLLTQGKSVALYNTSESSWQHGQDPSSHTLLATFLLHPRQVKLLQKYPIQKLIVYWERGYEGYSIYPVTIFRDQLGCLD